MDYSQKERNIPSILPISCNIDRPFWSVMIPVYNCANYLRKTLESVLIQDPGLKKMQIEVVDDYSTRDDPEEVVNRMGKGRILFYRQPRNCGPTSNFNTCIQRSRGYWVHILHGDDYLDSSFYEKMFELTQKYEKAALIASRCFYVNEECEILEMSPRIPTLESFSRNAEVMYYENLLRTPAVVINRVFYEKHGGFNNSLIHCADWEMWLRAISKTGGVMLNLPLAYYRFFDQNHTGRLMRTAEDLNDYLRMGEICGADSRDFDLEKYNKRVAQTAYSRGNFFLSSSDVEAAKASYGVWRKIVRPKGIVKEILNDIVIFFYNIKLFFRAWNFNQKKNVAGRETTPENKAS